MGAVARGREDGAAVQVTRLLTHGGMSEIFVGRVAALGQDPVVLKRLAPKYAQDPKMRRMFKDEARISRLVSGHPNIVTYLGQGEHEGSEFIALELVQGLTVAEILQRCSAAATPVPPAVAVHIVLAVLSALEHAHSVRDELGAPLELIHRDVTPQNIIVSWDGAVKLLDFGVSRSTGRAHRTEPGLVKGKPYFMAPEQLELKVLDRRVDLFSLAIVLYFLITLRHPFEGHKDMNVLAAMTQGRPQDPRTHVSDLPRSLCQDVLLALSLDPQDRFESASEMQEALLTSAVSPCSRAELVGFIDGLGPTPGPIPEPTFGQHPTLPPPPSPTAGPSPTADPIDPEVPPPRVPGPPPITLSQRLWPLVWGLAGILAVTWALRLWALLQAPALIIDSYPPGAQVFVGERQLEDTTPLTLNKWPARGPVMLRWTMPGFQDCRTVVEPRWAQTLTAQCRLRSTP